MWDRGRVDMWDRGVVTCGRLGGSLKELVSSTVRPNMSACQLYRDTIEYRIGSAMDDFPGK